MGVSFIKSGKAAQEEMVKEEKQNKELFDASVYKRRIWLKPESSRDVTFLTGSLDEDGILDAPAYYEHNLNMNGSWRNWFPCTRETEPCPICEGGDRPALVFVYLVIDHEEWEDKQGNTHVDELRLLVAKRESQKDLQKLATETKGLVGQTVTLERSDADMSASIGDSFKKKGAKKKLPTLLKKCKIEALPEWEDVIEYKDGKALVELGFGTYSMGELSDEPPETGGSGGNDADNSKGYENQL